MPFSNIVGDAAGQQGPMATGCSCLEKEPTAQLKDG